MKNNAVKRYSSFSLPSLLLVFGAASGLFDAMNANAATAPEPPVLPPNPVTQTIELQQPGHTYWQHPQYDAVLEVWTSADSGLRGKVVYINPEDKKSREAIGKILQKSEKDVTLEDVKTFVGMEGDLHLHQEEGQPDKWTGTIYWPYKGKSYGVDVDINEDNLHVVGFLLHMPKIGLFSKTVDLKPATPPKTDIGVPPKTDIAMAGQPKP